jgi:hypothetical protein
MTDVYEGSLIRLFRRLEELLRQIAQAAKVMGGDDLEQKFTAALELVRRDLVSTLEEHPQLFADKARRWLRNRSTFERNNGTAA